MNSHIVKLPTPSGNEILELDTIANKKMLHIYRAVNHELRLKMLLLIAQNPGIMVTQIHQQLQIEQAVASQHLKILRVAAMVQTQRNGKFIYYSINEKRIKLIIALSKLLTT